MQKMNPHYKSLWVAALRSGKYQQCSGYYMGQDGCYCVLGVLAKVIAQDKHRRGYYHMLRDRLRIVADLDPDVQTKLIQYNDHEGRSFRWLASYIERYL